MIKLRVISHPKKGRRSHLILDSKTGPILKGNSVDAPAYCCGKCGAILIEGVAAEQFIDASHPVYSDRELEIWAVPLKPGEHIVKQTIPVPDKRTTTITDNGPLVLTCYQCGATNEMTAPNILGPVQ
jgi:hypothetical protein